MVIDLRWRLAAACVAWLATASVANASDPDAPMTPARLSGQIGFYAPSDTDFTLVVASKETGPLRDLRLTRRRHGAWLKTETLDGLVSSNSHMHLPSGLMLDEGASDGRRYLSIRRPNIRKDSTDYRPVATGRHQTFLGETCQEWDVYRGVENGKPTYRHFACVTADGIELSSWSVSQSGGDLSFQTKPLSVSRAPVQLVDVEPPARLFDPKLWRPRQAPGARRNTGAEILLVAAGSGEKRIVRASGDWRYDETRRADGSRWIVSSLDRTGFVATAVFNRGRPESLSVAEGGGPSPFSPFPLLDRPPETILNLTCGWYDMAPGLSDGGALECRTPDGWPLKMIKVTRGRSEEYEAISITRGAQPPEAMMPPAALFDLKTWIGR